MENTAHNCLPAYSIRLHFNENLIFEMSFRSACSCSVLSRPSFTMLCVNVDSTTGLPRKISSREKIHSYITWHLRLPLFTFVLQELTQSVMFCFQTALSIYRSFPVELFFLQRSLQITHKSVDPLDFTSCISSRMSRSRSREWSSQIFILTPEPSVFPDFFTSVLLPKHAHNNRNP